MENTSESSKRNFTQEVSISAAVSKPAKRRKRSGVPTEKSAWRQLSDNTVERWHSLTVEEQRRERAAADAAKKRAKDRERAAANTAVKEAQATKKRAQKKADSNHAHWSEETEAAVLQQVSADVLWLGKLGESMLASNTPKRMVPCGLSEADPSTQATPAPAAAKVSMVSCVMPASPWNIVTA